MPTGTKSAQKINSILMYNFYSKHSKNNLNNLIKLVFSNKKKLVIIQTKNELDLKLQLNKI